MNTPEQERDLELQQTRLSIAIQESQLAELKVEIEKLLLDIERIQIVNSYSKDAHHKLLISQEISEMYCSIEVFRCKERKAKYLVDHYKNKYMEVFNKQVTSSPNAS